MATADILTPSAEVRALYRAACHGDGAATRRIARRQLDTIAERDGRAVAQMLTWHGLDLRAYFASRPLTVQEG